MTSEETINSCKTKMKKAFEVFNSDLGSLRTGRANAAMLDTIRVEVYGQQMPINQIATITVPEARLISIQVWDQSNVKLIDSAIQKSDLGVNPQVDGQTIRIAIPDFLLEYANINKDVIVIGMLKKIELWDKKTLDKYNGYHSF